MPESDFVEKHIRAWLKTFVVGLNLCPFARPLLGAENLRIAICPDRELEACHRVFLQELDRLQATTEDEMATTLLAFSNTLGSFEEYLNFFAQAQNLLLQAGLDGLIQLASFHPNYQFEGEEPEAASHYSNRAPYPIIHLLREDMMERVLRDYPNPQNIPEHNIATLQKLGVTELRARWQSLKS